jgi:arylsulfatase A-like enzyme
MHRHMNISLLCSPTRLERNPFCSIRISIFVVAPFCKKLLGSFFCFAVLTVFSADHPNVLVIISDDQGYHDVGVHGSTEIPTPNIDSIAKNGVRFTSGYVSGLMCSPTRAAFLAGRYQQRFGHEHNLRKADGFTLQETTLADRLKAAGYITGLVGKWHLGAAEKHQPMSRGFDEFFGFLAASHSYLDWGPGKHDDPILRGRQRVPVEQTYLTDAFGREAADFLQRHAKGEKPFFLYLAFNAVHVPLEAIDKYAKRFPNLKAGRLRYAAMTSAMDDAVGVVLGALRDTGMETNTIVFFFSDKGGAA